MPNVDDLRRNFFDEAYGSRYSIHFCSSKMYLDIDEVYWWKGLKKDIEEFVAKCLNCQQVKAEHQGREG